MFEAISSFLDGLLALIAGGTIGSGSSSITVGGIVPWIINNGTVATFVLGIPVISFACGVLSRLIHRTFR